MRPTLPALCFAAILTGAAGATTVIDEWASVKPPAPPELKPVTIDPATTALVVMDIASQSCTAERRPRCVATLPYVAKLLKEARAKGVLVVYTMAGTSKRADISPEVAPIESEQSLSGAGPDKFNGIDLDGMFKGKNIKTVITVGTSAEGAVLHSSASAAFHGYSVVVPIDCLSSSQLYAEQYTVWHLANAPRLGDKVTLSRTDMITF